MPVSVPERYAFNRTRLAYLATELEVANTHWSRFRGLMAREADRFREGQGLWIVPCRGVHTLGMRFPIDVLYLDSNKVVVHVEKHLKPWRLAPVRMEARSVLELPGTTVNATQTAVGDKIEIECTESCRTEAP
jgi:uncharacterized membrane protein (UPF0127 family)